MKRLSRIAALVTCVATPLLSQDTTRGVRIGLSYTPGTRPGVIVLRPSGPVSAAADSIRAILQRDLDFGDRVTIVTAPDSVLAAITNTTDSLGGITGLDYGVFKALGVLAVVQPTLTPRGLHIALHDVAQGQVLKVGEFPLAPDALSRAWRLGVHGASDEVEARITGVKGIAATRISFTRGGAVRLVDSDGLNEQAIPMVAEGLSPNWSSNGQAIVYSTFGVDSRIVVYDLRTLESRQFGIKRNTNNSTPTFSPDGSTIVYAATDQDGADLFAVSATGSGPPRRLTMAKGDNVQPSFSPDGRRIAFMSTRAGPKEIYIMDADGTNAEMLTSYDFSPKNFRSSPDWSPDGRQIAYDAYSPENAQVFQVFTMSLHDHIPKPLTSEGENESPSWAPDGRHLVLTSTRSGAKQLWILDTETGRARQLTHSEGARLAAWSTRLIPSIAP